MRLCALLPPLVLLHGATAGPALLRRGRHRRAPLRRPLGLLQRQQRALSLLHQQQHRGWPVEPEECKTLGIQACKKANQCLWHQGACEAFQWTPFTDLPYPRTCNNGTWYGECFDVDACAKGAPGPTPDAKWAFVFTHTVSLEKGPFGGIPNATLGPLRALADRLGNTDILLIKPPRGTAVNYHKGFTYKTRPVKAKVAKMLHAQGVKVLEVPWVLPPKMRFTGYDDYWCGAMDFIRLHILGLQGYAAVAYFDTDTILTGQGDPTAPLRCAAKGNFLAAGGIMSPLNSGFFAVRPDPRLLAAAVRFAETADYDRQMGTGWGSAGLAPWKRGLPVDVEYPGSSCGQGFLHTLFYKTTDGILEAFRHAGIRRPQAGHLDRCAWNFQGERDCGPWPQVEQDFDCDKIVMIHKEGAKCTRASLGLTV